MSSCIRCNWFVEGGQFVCEWAWGEWDVNEAERIVAQQIRDGSARSITLSWRALRRYAARDGWLSPDKYHAPHLPHVDVGKPAIWGTVTDVPGLRRFLIEGQHRAIRCLLERRDLTIYLLSKTDTDSITLRRRRVKRASHAPASIGRAAQRRNQTDHNRKYARGAA